MSALQLQGWQLNKERKKPGCSGLKSPDTRIRGSKAHVSSNKLYSETMGNTQNSLPQTLSSPPSSTTPLHNNQKPEILF